MEDFIRVLVTPLLDYPENLTITMIENPNEIVYQLSVQSEDMGKARSGGKVFTFACTMCSFT